jgi:Glu-tRNA(Gln) amidotransferase subunit E-like FAD-binding protein
VKTENNKVYYNLDRLGIPLIEIATKPEIRNAEQAKEAALHIGNVLRSCKVKRGIGTIRQDVNISIRGENRIEMKGVQDIKMFLKTVENEVLRQKELSDKGKPTKAEVRNALPDGSSEFLRPMPGADRMYPETDLPLLKISRNLINEIKKTLPKLRNDIEGELKERGLNEEMIKLLLKSNKIDEFNSLTKIYADVNFVAKLILLFPKEIASKTGKKLEEVEEIMTDIYSNILFSLEKKDISQGDVKEVMTKIVNGELFDSAIKIEKAESSEVEERILKIIKEKPGLNPNAYMGLVMKEFKGKIDGKEAMKIINKLLK